MHKDKAEIHIKENLSEGEELIGFFQAMTPFMLWMFLFGPLAALAIKQYFIAISDKGIYFHKLNLWGKFTTHDFFAYDEIAAIEIEDGKMQMPMLIHFKEAKKLKLKAQKKGLKRVAKIDDETIAYIRAHSESSI